MMPDIMPAGPADLPAILDSLTASKLPRAGIEERGDHARTGGFGRVGVAGVHHGLPEICVGDGETAVT
jgi:hypothetical protein